MKKKTTGNRGNVTLNESLQRAKVRLTAAKQAVKSKKQLARLAKSKFKQAKRDLKRARKIAKKAKVAFAKARDEIQQAAAIAPKKSAGAMSVAVRPTERRRAKDDRPAAGIRGSRRPGQKQETKLQKKSSGRKPAGTHQRTPSVGSATGAGIPTPRSEKTSAPPESEVGSPIPTLSTNAEQERVNRLTS